MCTFCPRCNKEKGIAVCRTASYRGGLCLELEPFICDGCWDE